MKFRPIGINRNLETHILELRNGVPDAIAGIHWLAFGPNTFNALTPFYSQVTDTPACYRDTPLTTDSNYIYWISRILALIGDSNYALYQNLQSTYEQEVMQLVRAVENQTDQQGDFSTSALEKANQQMADIVLQHSQKLLNDVINLGSQHMKLRFSVSD